ncbi:MAG: HAD family phosphatase [Butyricicoccus sp.]|nr:HAD family phosphatase [Butyricicoccus sp.]
MIAGAIFDMDGTLLDSMCVWDQLSQRYLDKFGVRITAIDYAALEARTQYQGAEYFCQRYPEITETPAEVAQGLDDLIRARYEVLARPREGIYDLLDALRGRGVRMAVATLTDREHAEKALRDRGMLDYFDFMLTIHDVGVSKRDPKIYYETAKRLHLPPASCLVFEDAPYAAQTAKKAGFPVCGVLEPTYAAGEKQLRAASDWFVERSFSEVQDSILQSTQQPAK